MRSPAFTVLWLTLGASLVIASTFSPTGSLAVAQTGGNPFRKADQPGSAANARVPGVGVSRTSAAQTMPRR